MLTLSFVNKCILKKCVPACVDIEQKGEKHELVISLHMITWKISGKPTHLQTARFDPWLGRFSTERKKISVCVAFVAVFLGKSL